jgi:cytidyltransferase-like protein
MFKFNKQVELVLEQYNERVIAVVPGAFRPPHKGHLELMQQYASKADKVIILISPDNPSARLKRTTPSGKYISAEISKQLWNLYIMESKLHNVYAVISDQASPVGAAYDFVANENNDPNKAQPGDLVILGVSTKGGDEQRFQKSAQKYAREGVEVIVQPFEPTTPISATDFRAAIDEGPEQIKPFLPDVIQDKADQILQIIQIIN